MPQIHLARAAGRSGNPATALRRALRVVRRGVGLAARAEEPRVPVERSCFPARSGRLFAPLESAVRRSSRRLGVLRELRVRIPRSVRRLHGRSQQCVHGEKAVGDQRRRLRRPTCGCPAAPDVASDAGLARGAPCMGATHPTIRALRMHSGREAVLLPSKFQSAECLTSALAENPADSSQAPRRFVVQSARQRLREQTELSPVWRSRAVSDSQVTSTRQALDQRSTSARQVLDQCSTSARPVLDQCSTRQELRWTPAPNASC